MATGYAPQQMAAVRQQTMLQQQLAMGHPFRTPHPAVPGMTAQAPQVGMMAQPSTQMPMVGMGQWGQPSASAMTPGGASAPMPGMGSTPAGMASAMSMRMPGMAGFGSSAMMSSSAMPAGMAPMPGAMMTPPVGGSISQPSPMEMSQMAVRRPPLGYSGMHGHEKMTLNPMANPVIQQQWLQARMMREGATGAPSMMEELGGASMFPHTPHNRFPPGQGNVHQRLLHAGIPSNILQHHRPDERKLVMEAVEEDDLDDEASDKQLASARYRRNHLLLADIFSDVMVPDPKPSLTEARLKTIQQHYSVLEKQKVALEEELAALENNFSDVKESIASDKERYKEQLQKVKENPDASVLPVPHLPVDSEPAVITRIR